MIPVALASLATIGAVVVIGGTVRFVKQLFALKHEAQERLRWGR